MKEKNKVMIPAMNIHPQPLIFSDDICNDRVDQQYETDHQVE